MSTPIKLEFGHIKFNFENFKGKSQIKNFTGFSV